MTDTMLQDRVVARDDVATGERRRAGRMANPSPELIALMRRPTEEARRRLALYDAPNFVPAEEPGLRLHVNPTHSLRVVGAVSICIGVWGGVLTAMMLAWS